MRRLTFALILGLLISGSSSAQQSLAGTYKLSSRVQEFQGSGPVEAFGKSPRGYLILSSKHFAAFFTADIRKPGTSEAEKAALYDTLTGWSGRYRSEGSKLIMRIDASSTESGVGSDMVWNIQLAGNRLTLASNPQPQRRDPSKIVVTTLVWERVE